MTPFIYVLLGHLVGDYLFQTNWMAKEKSKNWAALLLHCTIYTFSVWLLAFWGGFILGPVALSILFISHVVLDRRTFNLWWNRTVMKNPDQHWLHIVTDQIFHILVLAIIVHYGF